MYVKRVYAENLQETDPWTSPSYRFGRAARPTHGQVAPAAKHLQFFRESPLVGAELDLERDKDTGRNIEL